jgi:hypothetical protein
VSTPDDYPAALTRADAAVADLTDADFGGDASRREATVRRLHELLADASERARTGDLRPGGASAAGLSRVLVDGNGPREAQHPVFSAFADVDRARDLAFGQSLQPMPAATLESLTALEGPVPGSYLNLIKDYAVFAPTPAGSSALVATTATDGRKLLLAASSRGSFDELMPAMVTGAVTASLARIGDLLAQAPALGAAGLVLDPGLNDILLLVPDAPAVVPRGSEVSVGGAAQVPPALAQAAEAAARAVPSVAQVFAMSLVEGATRARLVWVVQTDGVEADALRAFGAAMASRVPAGTPLDLLPATSPLAQAGIRGVEPLYRRGQ